MFRAVLAGLGLTNKVPPAVYYSPFSKSSTRMSQQPAILLSRPLQMRTTYSAVAATAKKQHGLFGENNVQRIKSWITDYYKDLPGINPKHLTVTKLQLDAGDRFAGLNSDKLLNKHVVVYPSDALGSQIWKKILDRAAVKKKILGVLELSTPVSCYKVTLAKGFWFVLIPHNLLNPLHRFRGAQDLERKMDKNGITRKNK